MNNFKEIINYFKAKKDVNFIEITLNDNEKYVVRLNEVEVLLENTNEDETLTFLAGTKVSIIDEKFNNLYIKNYYTGYVISNYSTTIKDVLVSKFSYNDTEIIINYLNIKSIRELENEFSMQKLVPNSPAKTYTYTIQQKDLI